MWPIELFYFLWQVMSAFFNLSSSVRPFTCLAVLFCIRGAFNSTTKVHIKHIIIIKSNNTLIVEENNTTVLEVGDGAQLAQVLNSLLVDRDNMLVTWRSQSAPSHVPDPFPVPVFSDNTSSSSVLYNLFITLLSPSFWI